MAEPRRKKGFYVLTYDVVSDRRRVRIANLLESYGERIQDSVYELRLSPRQRERLAQRLEKEFDPKEDRLRWYCLCAQCVERIICQGVGPQVFEIAEVMVI